MGLRPYAPICCDQQFHYGATPLCPTTNKKAQAPARASLVTVPSRGYHFLQEGRQGLPTDWGLPTIVLPPIVLPGRLLVDPYLLLWRVSPQRPRRLERPSSFERSRSWRTPFSIFLSSVPSVIGDKCVWVQYTYAVTCFHKSGEHPTQRRSRHHTILVIICREVSQLRYDRSVPALEEQAT